MKKFKNLNGVMETETISKNGRSLKSLTSRGNFLMPMFVILCLSLLMSCKKDRSNNYLLDTPTGLSATQHGTSISILWSSVADATSYRIYRSNNASGTYTQIGDTSYSIYTDYRSYEDYNPLDGSNYYKVKAVNNAGESDYSNYMYCDFSGGIPTPPIITMPSSITIDFDDLWGFSFDVAVLSPDEDLTSIRVFIRHEGFILGLEEITEPAPFNAWNKTYTAVDFMGLLEIISEDLTLEFCIEAKTQNSESFKSATITIINATPPPSPLEGPVNFTWQRISGQSAEGLVALGLEWQMNTATHIVIRPLPGSKLVVLTPIDWNALDTKEELAEAVDAGMGIDRWEVIPINNTTFNHVIATRTGEGKYFLINPTESTVILIEPSGGLKITVTGQYKY